MIAVVLVFALGVVRAEPVVAGGASASVPPLTTLPSVSPACATHPVSAIALLEELNRHAIERRELEEMRAQLDRDRRTLDEERKAFAAAQTAAAATTAPPTTAAPQAAAEAPPAARTPQATNTEPNRAPPALVDTAAAGRPSPSGDTVDVDRIAKTLQGMKAANAGAVLKKLDAAIASQVIGKMSRARAAAVLETLTPEQAAMIATSFTKAAP